MASFAPRPLHDLRRTVVTRLAEKGTAPHILERIINHVSGEVSGVAAVYNRARYEKEVRQALELWSDRIALMASTTPYDGQSDLKTAS